MSSIATIDLFCGAGGMSIGAKAAGARIMGALDFDAASCQTIRQNKGHVEGEVLHADILTVDGARLRQEANIGRDEPLLIVGGAPCQPFSKAAYWLDPGDDFHFRQQRARGRRVSRPAPPAVRPDERRTLVDEYYRIVSESDADAFVFENVPSILHPRNRPVLDRLLRRAAKDGFYTTVVEANATDFGVAQRRQRVFVLASKAAMPAAPAPETSSWWAAKPALAGPVLKPFAGSKYHEPEEEVTGRWAKHLREIPAGMNYKHHTAWAGHPKPTFVTETRFWNFLLKLDPAQPSWTIPANPGPWVGPFHWDSRRLRTPELAALQGFPKGYQFSGARRERVRQIGNAVPPPMAAAMVEATLHSLGERALRSVELLA